MLTPGAPPLELSAVPPPPRPRPLLRPRTAPQQLQLAAVPLPLVRSCQLELVPVDVEDGGGEVWVGGELTLEAVRVAAVEEVTAAALAALHPLVEHGGVAERVAAAPVQAPRQARHLGLVEEGGAHGEAVLRPDDGVGLKLEYRSIV